PFLALHRRAPRPTPFPYTTLFRSLARPVPPEGQARLLILKTYKDLKSFYHEGDAIVFKRPLSIPRNSVVLPAGYELVACSAPSQDRKSTRLNSSHLGISYAVFCLK